MILTQEKELSTSVGKVLKAKPHPLRNHRLPLTCVCVDSKDRHAFTASKDGSIIKWELISGEILAKVNSISSAEAQKDKSAAKNFHHRHINCMAISSDDKFLATGGHDRHIRIWSPKDLSLIHIFTKHKEQITTLAFRQGHNFLYSGSEDRSVMLWTLEEDDNRCYVESLYGHEASITSMDVLKRERVLTAGGRDQSIRVWKIVEQAQTVFQTSHESVDVVRLIDDKTFVSGGEDGSLCVWTTMKRSPVTTLSNAHGTSNDLESNPGLRHWISALATFSFKEPIEQVKSVKKRKLADDVLVSQFDDDEHESGNSSSSEAEGNEGQNDTKKSIIALIASGSCNCEIRIWNLIKTGSKHELQLHQTIDCPGFINDLRFTRDGSKIVAACGQEHKFGRWWKLRGTRNCMRVFDVNKDG